MTKADKRDVRIDVIRGLALLMIFVDHMPRDWLGWVTLHVLGFSDAAEVFVLLAGVSAMLAYGRGFARDGALAGLRRVALRCGRIYVFQIGLLLITLGVVYVWKIGHHLPVGKLAPIFDAPATGLAYGLTLRALPSYLDILPLYIVLLAAFPLIYLLLRRSAWLALGVSALVWLATNAHPALDLPNWIDGQGWYFNPFAWQFLFTIGAVLAGALAKYPERLLPFRPWLAAICGAYLFGAFLEAAPWSAWGLPDLRPFVMAAPDKSVFAWPRLLHILALTYLVFSSIKVQRLVRHRLLRPIAACGRHSLEVFSTCCVLTLFGRLTMRSYGAGLWMQILVNAIGFTAMILVALRLEQRRAAPKLATPLKDTDPIEGGARPAASRYRRALRGGPRRLAGS